MRSTGDRWTALIASLTIWPLGDAQTIEFIHRLDWKICLTTNGRSHEWVMCMSAWLCRYNRTRLCTNWLKTLSLIQLPSFLSVASHSTARTFSSAFSYKFRWNFGFQFPDAAGFQLGPTSTSVLCHFGPRNCNPFRSSVSSVLGHFGRKDQSDSTTSVLGNFGPRSFRSSKNDRNDRTPQLVLLFLPAVLNSVEYGNQLA